MILKYLLKQFFLLRKEIITVRHQIGFWCKNLLWVKNELHKKLILFELIIDIWTDSYIHDITSGNIALQGTIIQVIVYDYN